MSELAQRISQAVLELTAPDCNAQGAKKKNYTEALSHRVSDILADELRTLGLTGVEFHAKGRDKQFMGRDEALREEKKFGSVLAKATALFTSITGRERPEDAPELYETAGILLIQPGDPDSVDLAPQGVPKELQAEGYCQRLVDTFRVRNPFF